MRERIDPTHPQPLYYQVAETIRYRIATGELRPGMRLPSLRRAAQVWGVNMHTARRAYHTLAEQGLVEMRERASAVVLRRVSRGDTPAPNPSQGEGSTFEAFLTSVLREADSRWGLPPAELVRRLEARLARKSASVPVVYVIECSESQARDLSSQLEARFSVDARPWSLERDGEPPEGLLLATYFHYNDVRCRWPLREVHFAATHPDPALRTRLTAWARRQSEKGPLKVVLCEREATMARNVLADLVRILPASSFSVTLRIEEPARLLESASGPILFAPRVWGDLSDEQHAHPCALEARYVFAEKDLNAIDEAHGWSSVGPGAESNSKSARKSER